MEKENIKDLIGDSLNKLNDLKSSLEKLSAASAEIAKEKANELLQNVATEAQQKATQVEEKVTEVINSEQFKNLEQEGKKTVEEMQVQITELTGKALDVVNEFSQKINAALNKNNNDKA